ncbi:MAG: porin family protein [Arenibacter sp.]|nr:porin family protein [Arenibacter sp.]
MKGALLIVCYLVGFWGFAQEVVIRDEQDRKFLEDQFYLGVTYNFLWDLPEEVEQRNLSYGLQGGFIKDIPLNWDRTIGLGWGIGYAINSYYSNVRAVKAGDNVSYELLERTTAYKRNKIETHAVEMPIQFRWRNATAEDYKFWRVYTGIKFGYVFGNRSKFVDDTTKIGFYNRDVRKIQYGLALDVGYNTFNIHAYYSLTSLFRDGVTLNTGTPLDHHPLQIGLIFYIL